MGVDAAEGVGTGVAVGVGVGAGEGVESGVGAGAGLGRSVGASTETGVSLPAGVEGIREGSLCTNGRFLTWGYRLLLGYGCAKTILPASGFHINVPHTLQANGTETTVSLSPSIRSPAISNAPCISERPRTELIPLPSSSKSGPAATHVKASQEWTPSARRPGSVKPSSSGTTYTETSETVLSCWRSLCRQTGSEPLIAVMPVHSAGPIINDRRSRHPYRVLQLALGACSGDVTGLIWAPSTLTVPSVVPEDRSPFVAGKVGGDEVGSIPAWAGQP